MIGKLRYEGQSAVDPGRFLQRAYAIKAIRIKTIDQIYLFGIL